MTNDTNEETMKDMSLEERIDFEIQDQTEKEEAHALLKELNESCRGLFNQEEILKIEAIFEDDPYFDDFSTEAWNVTATIKKTLTRFRMFFKKIFRYVNNFTILRVKLSIKVAEQWLNTLNTAEAAKIDELKSKYNQDSDKNISTIQAVEFLDSAAKYYKAASDQVAKVKGLTVSETRNASDTSSDKMEQTFGEVEEVKTYREKWKAITDTFPSKEDQNATVTNGVTPENGKWFDKTSIDTLIGSMKRVIGQLQNLKRLQMDCETIVSDLEKNQSSGEDDKTINLLNKNKIEFLRKFSNEILSNAMGNIGRAVSIAAKQCQKFNGKTENNSKTE